MVGSVSVGGYTVIQLKLSARWNHDADGPHVKRGRRGPLQL